MINKIKNTLNIFLAVILLSATVQATDIMDVAIGDLATVNTYTEPNGTTNYYSPSMSIRFDRPKVTGPLFAFTPPSLEAGCSGIDIKGMFMSLIGGDELEQLFSDAGTSVAWGIALGIIYSLPGVANAFKFINGWAKKLQQLLAAACGAGIEIGQWLAKESGINSQGLSETVDGFAAKLDPDNYIKAKKKGHNGILELMGWYDDGNPGASTLDELNDEDKLEAIAELMRGIFESDASMFSGIFKSIAREAKGLAGNNSALESFLSIPASTSTGNAVQVVQVKLNQTTVAGLAGILNSGGGLTNVSQAQLSLFAYVLVYNFVGDLAIGVPSESAIKEMMKGLVSGADKVKAKEQYENLKKKKLTKVEIIAGLGGMSSEKEKAQGLAKFIWYGTTDGGSTEHAGQTTADNRAKNRLLMAPTLSIYTIRDGGTTGKSAYIPVFTTTENTANEDYYNAANTYKGTIMTSRCVIDALVDGNGSTETVTECGGSIVFPQVHKYIKIIKDSPIGDQYPLKAKLVKMMSVKMAEAILGAISESLGHIKSSSGGAIATASGGAGESNTVSVAAKDTVEAILKHRENLSYVVEEAGIFLDDKLGEKNGDMAKLETAFIIQDRKNRERGLKSLQK